MSDDNSGRQTQSIADQLDMDLGLDDEPGSDGSLDDSELYEADAFWSYEGRERGLPFVVLWDEYGYPPQSDLPPIAEALLDDESHRYRITFGGGSESESEGDEDERTTGFTGLALLAHVDDEAEVEVLE